MADQPARRPWHLWAVGVFVLLFAGAGAYDQVMSLSQRSHYFDQQGYGAAERDYFSDYPSAPALLWIIAVWGTVAAAALLLAQSRWAAITASVSLLSQACLLVITFTVMDRWAVFGAALSIVDLAILLLTAGFAAYCWSMWSRGLLR